MKFAHFFLLLGLILIVISGSLLIGGRHQTASSEAQDGRYSASQGESPPLESGNISKVEPGCMHPGYGELNIHSIKLDEKNVTIHRGDKAVITGIIAGKEYHVRESDGPENTCYYDGRVVLKAYLGPGASKDSWSYMQGKLGGVEGLEIKITPENFLLEPNETLKFQIEVSGQEEGVYHLYIVAFGGKGWKSWDVVEVNVR